MYTLFYPHMWKTVQEAGRVIERSRNGAERDREN